MTMGRRDVQEPVRTYKEGPSREKGEYEEEHPAFGTAVVSRASGSPRTLFQSDLQHSETIRLSISRAIRGRLLMRDWVHPRRELIEIEMSLAQWGSLVSSMGIGSGVPVTIRRTESDVFVPGIPYEPRIATVVEESKKTVSTLLEHIRSRYAVLRSVIDNKGGVKATREAADSLKWAIENAESNTGFAVKSVADATEHVVEQAKADIESHILNSARALGIEPTFSIPEMGIASAADDPRFELGEVPSRGSEDDGWDDGVR